MVTAACTCWPLICIPSGLISAQKGWWNAAGSVKFYQCVASEACPGGKEKSTQPRLTDRRSEPADEIAPNSHQSLPVLPRRADLSNGVELGAVCKEGSSGVLCGVCDDGYVLQSDGQCSKCDSNTDLIVLWLMGALGIVVCLTVACCIYKQCGGTDVETEAESTMVDVGATERATELRNKVLAQWAGLQALAGPLKIMIGFHLLFAADVLILCDACRWVQIISTLTSQFSNVPWPSVSHYEQQCRSLTLFPRRMLRSQTSCLLCPSWTSSVHFVSSSSILQGFIHHNAVECRLLPQHRPLPTISYLQHWSSCLHRRHLACQVHSLQQR